MRTNRARKACRARLAAAAAAAFIVTTAAMPSALAAAPLVELWKTCSGSDNFLDQKIAACTEIIGSPGVSRTDRATAYGDRGTGYATKNEIDLALRDYDEAVRLDPKSANSYIFRGNAQRHLRRFDAAIADYSRALAIDAKSTQAFVGLGNVYADRNEDARAIAEYDQAIRIDPQYVLPYLDRASTFYEEKDYGGAIDSYTQAIQLDATNAFALYWRGMAKQMTGDRDGGNADIAAAKRINPDIGS